MGESTVVDIEKSCMLYDFWIVFTNIKTFSRKVLNLLISLIDTFLKTSSRDPKSGESLDLVTTGFSQVVTTNKTVALSAV